MRWRGKCVGVSDARNVILMYRPIWSVGSGSRHDFYATTPVLCLLYEVVEAERSNNFMVLWTEGDATSADLTGKAASAAVFVDAVTFTLRVRTNAR